MILTKNLHYCYEDKQVLTNINLEILKGTFTAIIGANGSGKTTLAKHFNALLVPDKGDVFVDDINTKESPREVRKKVGCVFQNPEDQIVHSIVEEDVAFGLENLGIFQTEMQKRVKETLIMLNITHLEKSNVNFLSAGQKQLVALAGVLAMMPDYIILDEPTTLLDSMNKKNIISIITRLNKKEKKTIILVTNLLGDLRYAERIIVLKSGEVIFNGTKSRITGKIIEIAGLVDDDN